MILGNFSVALTNTVSTTALSNFKVILLSIVLEALPFVLLSVIVSAFLHNFVADSTLQKVIPKNRLFSIIPAALLGVLFPVCDCGMVPIVRRLVSKGVPLHSAVAFMLAAPIVNPVVAAATTYAFRTNTAIVVLRVGVAFLVSCLAGFMCSVFFNDSQLQATPRHSHGGCACHPPGGDCYYEEYTFSEKLIHTVRDAGSEFFAMGKYLLAGAMLGAAVQVLLPRPLLVSVGLDSVLSIGLMILFAFVVSVCSSADAFIAASFVTTFSPGSLIAFMVFGPMMDLKNTFMLLGSFRFAFVACLLLTVGGLCAAAAYVINLALGV